MLYKHYLNELEKVNILEETKKYLEQIKEGLNLFSKYCMNLWD